MTIDKSAALGFRKINDEVFVAETPIVRFDRSHVDFLKRQAASNSKGRARLNAHPSNESRLHEMLIAISAASYIHPHKHIGKSESFHIVEGLVDIVAFDDSGAIIDVVELGDVASGRNFYYRLEKELFHTLLIHSDYLVIHEVTNGPFIREGAIYAPFAPVDTQQAEARVYIEGVKRAVELRRVR